jgi:hypothetical protein
MSFVLARSQLALASSLPSNTVLLLLQPDYQLSVISSLPGFFLASSAFLPHILAQ